MAMAPLSTTTRIRAVIGPTTITADPGSDEPIIEADGPTAQVIVNPTSDQQIHIGGLSLTDGLTEWGITLYIKGDVPFSSVESFNRWVTRAAVSTATGCNDYFPDGTFTRWTSTPFSRRTTRTVIGIVR